MPHSAFRVLAPSAAVGAALALTALLGAAAVPAAGAALTAAGARATHTAALAGPATAGRLTLTGGGRVLAGSLAGRPRTAVVLPAQEPGRRVTGGLSVTLSGMPPAHTPHRSGLSLHTLTVTGTNAAGQPDTGDQVMAGDVANANAPGTGWDTFDHGIAKFSVPAGTYWVLARFSQRSGGGRLTAIRLDVLPQLTVTQNTTVHTNAVAATSEVTMTTPRPAIAQSSTLTVVRTAPHAPPNGQSPKVNSFEQSVTHASLWISPVSHAPSYGGLQVFTGAQLTSPPGHAGSYIYTLDFADPPGIIPPQHFTARPAGLATVAERYVQDVGSVAAWETLGGTPYQIRTSFIGGPVLPVRLPARQVQYLSASPPMLWETTYSEYRTTYPRQTPGGQTSAFRLLHPGQHLTQTWNAYPLHPAANVSFPHTPIIPVRSSAARTQNILSLDVTPFSDNQAGHHGGGLVVPFPGKASQVSGSYALYQNGVKITSGNAVKATSPFGDVQVSAALSPKPTLIKFVLTASRTSAQYPLSATSRDVWTWHSRPQPGATIPPPWLCNFAAVPPARDRHCAVQPMITLAYNIAGLSLDGTTSAGHQAITITAGHIQLAPRIPVAQARAQVSFNGGMTWQQAHVRPLGPGRFQATFTAPRPAQVSLRITTRDAAGNSLTETILDTYQTPAHR